MKVFKEDMVLTDFAEEKDFEGVEHTFFGFQVKLKKNANKFISALLDADSTGASAFRYCKSCEHQKNNKLFSKAIQIILEMDKTGKWTYRLLQEVLWDSDSTVKEKFKKALIKKDKTGKWIAEYMYETEYVRTDPLLINALKKKDKTGEYIKRSTERYITNGC